MTSLKFGWLPTPEHLKVELTPHLTTSSVPLKVDNYSAVPHWGMMLNDQLGCCTCSGDGHIVCQQTAIGDSAAAADAHIVTAASQWNGTGELVPPDSEILKAYEFAGYVPGDPNTDQGWTVQAALEYLRTNGMAGWRIAAYGSVDVRNQTAIKQAVAEFGCLSIGFDVPLSAMQQFQEGRPWTPVPGSPIEGGHCVIVVGYDQDYLYVVTWGKVQAMSWSFWNTYVSEAHAPISKDWASQSGLSLQAFGEEFSAMFGGGNPFDQPTPKPQPQPSNGGCLPGWLARLFR